MAAGRVARVTGAVCRATPAELAACGGAGVRVGAGVTAARDGWVLGRDVGLLAAGAADAGFASGGFAAGAGFTGTGFKGTGFTGVGLTATGFTGTDFTGTGFVGVGSTGFGMSASGTTGSGMVSCSGTSGNLFGGMIGVVGVGGALVTS